MGNCLAGPVPVTQPAGPWVMVQRWHHLLFAHWRCPIAELRRLVPEPLELDTYDGSAWVGVVPFYMSGVRMRLDPAGADRVCLRGAERANLRDARWPARRLVLQPRLRVIARRHRCKDRHPPAVLPRLNGYDPRWRGHHLSQRALGDGRSLRRRLWERINQSANRSIRLRQRSSTSLPSAIVCIRLQENGSGGETFITRAGTCKMPKRASNATR